MEQTKKGSYDPKNVTIVILSIIIVLMAGYYVKRHFFSATPKPNTSNAVSGTPKPKKTKTNPTNTATNGTNSQSTAPSTSTNNSSAATDSQNQPN
jgi:cytoskeletal protein RodZ